MEDNGSSFILNNQSAAGMMSALHAAANIMEKSPPSISNTHFPFYPYVTPATLHSNRHHTPQVSTNSPKMAPTSVATPFGINDILSRTAAVDCFAGNLHGNDAIDDFKFNQVPRSAASMATIGSNLGGRRAAAAVAHTAAMLFNNYHEIGCHGNQRRQIKFTGKPLTDLPGRPPIYWPGVLTEDWHEKIGMQGLLKKLIVEVYCLIVK